MLGKSNLVAVQRKYEKIEETGANWLSVISIIQVKNGECQLKLSQ